MNRAALLSLAVLFGSAALSAQDLRQSQPQVSASGISCPISLRVRQTADAFEREVNGSRPKGVAQHLQITVTHPDSRRVVAASVTVYGFADKPRYVETTGAHDTPDAARTLDVLFPGGPGKEVSSDLRVPGLSAVAYIELNSVRFADGSVWKVGSGSYCRVPIDGFMLIKGR
jgi:hypothetical protein